MADVGFGHEGRETARLGRMVEVSGNESPAGGESRESSRVLVVIVNYRTADLVVDCLGSLVGERAALSGMRVVVTDNASGDGSVERIGQAIKARGWSEWARVEALERNGGFSYGNNAAIGPALGGEGAPEFVWLLNPDTVVRGGAGAALVRFMLEHESVGIVGSRLEYPDGREQGSARRMIRPVSELLSGARLGWLSRLLGRYEVALPAGESTYECDWVSGASMMVRREVFEGIGLLDEGYFLYFDEVDFCLRAKRAGWGVWFEPASRVVHLEGAATGFKAERRRRGRWWYESRRRFFVKAYGVMGLIAADVLWAIGRLSLAVRRLLRLGGDMSGDPAWFAWDLLAGDARALLTGRLPRRPGRRGEGR